MSKRPLVSVCIPCYNGAKFLARTMESVLVQTLTDFEMILADDKSTDETVSVIKRFDDNRIRFIENDSNLGLGLNWNRVMSRSVGKYVKLLCEDDILHPECLARQAEVLENPFNSSAVLAVCNRKVINSEDEVILSRRLPFSSGLASGATLIGKSVRLGSNLIGEPAVGMFRREVLERTGICDLSNTYLADLSLWAQLLKHGDAFLDPHYLAAFRISHGAVSSRMGLGQAAAFRRFVRTLREDPFYKISSADALMGYAFSLHWCLFRNLFIKVYRGRHGRRPGSTSALDAWLKADFKPCSNPSAWRQATASEPRSREKHLNAAVN